ncbi:MAG: hypothetical protein SAK29_34870 [Scytonema sp. PMC 1069.18]|nr:hypothetical protein [Scytonema sp. PMC 1069.18]MEC4888329.1 hypothetical protein [Scytonema sp. PMC 1070.18]
MQSIRNRFYVPNKKLSRMDGCKPGSIVEHNQSDRNAGLKLAPQSPVKIQWERSQRRIKTRPTKSYKNLVGAIALLVSLHHSQIKSSSTLIVAFFPSPKLSPSWRSP